MKTKRKLLYIYSFSLFLVIVTLVIFARYVFYSEFEDLEYRKVSKINELVRNEILKDLGRLSFKNKEWSTREENYKALQNKDYKAFEQNLNLSALRNLNIDVILYGNNQEYISGYDLSFDNNEKSRGLLRIPDKVIKLINKSVTLNKSKTTLEILNFGEYGCWLVSQLPVTDRYGVERSAGKFIVAKKLDMSYFEDLSTKLAINVYSKGVRKDNINTNKYKINNLLISDYSIEISSGEHFVFSIYHTPHILIAGRKSFKLFFITSSLMIMFIMGLTYYVLQRSLFSPIISLQNEVAELDINNLQEIYIKNADQEILILIQTINSLILRIKSDYELIVQKGKLESLGLMAGGIAHEINNPLTILKTNSAIILRELTDSVTPLDQKITQKLKKNLQTIDRIAGIITGLQKISRHSSEDEQVEVEASTIINNLKALNTSIIENKDILVEYKILVDNLKFKGLEQQVTQILINLLMNSSQAVQELNERWIKIELTSSRENVIFRVTDSGEGIPVSIQNKLMDPFFTTKDVGEGTGLGLSICRKIANFHKGELKLIPEAKNTTFELTIPLINNKA